MSSFATRVRVVLHTSMAGAADSDKGVVVGPRAETGAALGGGAAASPDPGVIACPYELERARCSATLVSVVGGAIGSGSGDGAGAGSGSLLPEHPICDKRGST